MSNSMQFVVTPLPTSDENLIDRIKDAADRSNKGTSLYNTTFNAIKSIPVVQLTASATHIALLLEDGRIYRTQYQVLADRLDLPSVPVTCVDQSAQIPQQTASNISGQKQSSSSSNNNTGTSSGPSGSSGGGGGGGSGGGSGGGGGGSGSSSQNRATIPGQVSGLSVQHRHAARRGRMLRNTASRGRGATSVIMGSRALIPAQYVPEDLITQAQVVLQGKPRNAIVRELQRTNLDVNLAVNNLLSSDNEDPEDMDESQDYLPNEDLMSLLDSSLPSGPSSVLIDAETVFPEDVFNAYSSARLRSGVSARLNRSNTSDRDPSVSADRELLRLNSQDNYVRPGVSSSSSRRWLEYALRETQSASDVPSNRSSPSTSTAPTDFTSHRSDSVHGSSHTKKTSSIDSNPIYISDTLELWPTNDKKFVQIACLFTELIAVSSNGQLHQWRWCDPHPFEGIRLGDMNHYHPKAVTLNLTNEKITLLSATCIRASVVTETNKVATWVDETISIVGTKLEHSAQSFPEFQRCDRITQLHTCSLYTCVRLDSGSLYWWGVAPFAQRKKTWKKVQTRASKQRSSVTGSNEISVGSVICLKNSPSYHSGAIGFTTSGGIPKVGKLMVSAWNITDTCTFKLIHPSEFRKYLTQSTTQIGSDSKVSSVRNRRVPGQSIEFCGITNEEQAPSSPGLSKAASSERLEMPPPPSPASSTCSEPGCSPLPKRKHRHLSSVKDEDKSREEEQWNLKDVVFLEDVKNLSVAKVVKLDGMTALVRFNQRDLFGQTDSDVNAYLQDCRMIRKDELQLVRGSSSSKVIDCQKSPRKINITDSSSILSIAVSNNGIHAIVQSGNKIQYKIYQITSGKATKSLTFPTDYQAFLGRDPSQISLHTSGENDVAVILRDGNGALYPLSKDCLDSIKEPLQLDMAPVQALSMAVHPVKDTSNGNKVHPTLVVALAMDSQILIPAILRSDPEYVRLTLASLEREPASQQVVAGERIDANRNILHAAVSACVPTSNKISESTTPMRPGNANDEPFEPMDTSAQQANSLHEAIKRSKLKHATQQQNLTINLAPSDNDSRSMPGLSDSDSTNAVLNNAWANDHLNNTNNDSTIDPTEQKQAAHSVLWILVESHALKPYLPDLMVQRDAHGMTPFMAAVAGKAYSAAIILLNVAQRIAFEKSNSEPENQRKLFLSMIFPKGTNLDNNPLYMLCANDTCSFTWTGAQHINQDIFECKTCGLTKTLCCCSECARVCHKGHECRLKRTSPTAYCDCWEKCKCKALVAGSQTARYQLLRRLISDTDLVGYTNSRGENILLFLVQTVGRQIVEQRQYGTSRSRHPSGARKPSDPSEQNMPDHDLEPPRFSRKALDKLLGEWAAVKAVINTGTSSTRGSTTSRYNPVLAAEDQALLSNQDGTALLDRFTHCILIKIGQEMLDVLLTTIIRESSNPNISHANEARKVAVRFVRSVARVGFVLSVELSPVNYSNQSSLSNLPISLAQVGLHSNAGSSNLWKKNQPSTILQKCRRVFQALLPIAAEQLAEIADAIIAPVRLGVTRPTAPFSLVNSMADATQGSEEIFIVDPVVVPSSSNLPSNPTLSDDNPNSSAPNNDSSRHEHPSERLLYDSSSIVDAADSEDADESNNVYRPEGHDESDSESDSNADDASLQSNTDNPSGHRSVTAGAATGSEVGAGTIAYFSEVESGDSSNPEDDEESEANDTEQDNEELAFVGDELSVDNRRPPVSNMPMQQSQESFMPNQQQNSSRPNLAQHLQWALRHRDQHSGVYSAPLNALPHGAARIASIGGIHTNNSYYLDASLARRTNFPSSHLNTVPTTSNELSMAATAVGLARAFSIIIRSISDLIPLLRESERGDTATLPINQLKVSPAASTTIIENIEKKLKPTWEWLLRVMDSTEGQLRFGCALTNGTNHVSTSQPIPSTSSYNHQPYRSSGINAALVSNPGPGIGFMASSVAPLPPTMLISRVPQQPSSSAQNLNPRQVPALLGDNRVHDQSSNANEPQGVRNMMPANPNSTANIRGQLIPTTSRTSGLNQGPSYIRMPPSDPHEVTDGTAARRDFLTYMISLIRGHGNEHYDSLPILDVSSLRHVAYVFDAYIYYLQALQKEQSGTKSPSEIYSETWNDDEADAEAVLSLAQNEMPMCVDEVTSNSSTVNPSNSGGKGSRHQFFRRSESTLYLGCPPPDPFSSPISEALPLAEQPHLLQPTSRREELFGIPRTAANASSGDILFDSLPTRLSLSARTSSSESSAALTCPMCSAKQQSPFTQSCDTARQSSSKQAAKETEENRLYCAIHTPISANKEITHTSLLGRWRLSLELFGGEFVDDVGAEPGSIISDLVGFPSKENRFRKDMERLRTATPREITFTSIDRDRNTLIEQTFKELNNVHHAFVRKVSSELPILAVSKIKVSFKDEKGEGNGVARSFYTAFCEAILSNEKLPRLIGCQTNARPSQYNLLQRIKTKEREREHARRTFSQQQSSSSRDPPWGSLPINANAINPNLGIISGTSNSPANILAGLYNSNAGHDASAHQNLNSPSRLISEHMSFPETFNIQSGLTDHETTACEEEDEEDNTPLFYQPGLRNFYSPRQGDATPERLNAFRNVGRIIGICLSQNEICPIQLNRHVIKYILKRPIYWHDLAFFDPLLYESLRQLILDAETNRDAEQTFQSLDLRFCVDLCIEEGGGQVELVPGGKNIEVTTSNVYDYVRRYSLRRMVRSQEKALQSMRQGVHDAIPACALENLTAEDFRLLLNGVGEINVKTLMSYTTFIDDRGKQNSGEHLGYFKKWFWSIVEKMTTREKQDLVYFWTGSPSLPASEEGFQPMPTVSIRPADDQHLPTSNVCIFRLYIPLYSSKTILKSKLLIAIKEKNFGFV